MYPVCVCVRASVCVYVRAYECVRVVGEVFAQSEFASFDENVSAFPLGLYLKFSLMWFILSYSFLPFNPQMVRLHPVRLAFTSSSA